MVSQIPIRFSGDRKRFIGHLILCIIDKRNPVYDFEQIVDDETGPSSDDSSDSSIVIKRSPVVENSDEDIIIGPSTAKPGPSIAKPGPSTAKPGLSTAKPGPSSAKPGLSTAKPGQKRKLGQSSIQDFFFKKKK